METGTRDNIPSALAAVRLLMCAGAAAVLRTLRLQAITWMLMIGVGASFTVHADQWMTSATGTTTSNGQSMSLLFGNGVTATYTQGATINNPPLCAGSTYAAPGAILGGTNVPGFIEPDPVAGSVSVSQCVGNGAPGVLRTLPHTFSFNKPVIGPVLHMQNLDGSVYDVTATTISGGAVAYTQLAKNNALEVAALSATTTRFNDTPQGANNFGCMLNNGGNPTGGCGSFRLTGGPVQTWTTANRLLIVLNTGDGWFWSVSFQTARLTKAFGAASIVAGQTTPLTFTIDNTNATNGTNASTAIALGPLDFTDVLPSGMTIANGTTSGTCAGATFQDASNGALDAGDTGVRVSGFTVPANATCTLTVNVTAASAGTYTNTAANMSSGIGNLVLAPNASLAVIEQPNLGTCDARMFLSQSPNISTNTTLYNINTGANPLTFPALGQGSIIYNSTAYNPQDNYIYAINAPGYSGNRLIRIGVDGSTVDLGVVTGLPVSEFNAGEIASDGTYYVYAGSPGSGTLYAVNIAARTATARSLSSGTQASDLAWIGGLLYTVDTSGQLKSINPGTGTVTNIGAASGGITLGALFGAPNGLFGSSNGGGFYKIDLLTGARTLISGSPGSGVNDGAHCATAAITFPADLAITKTDGNATYTPGTNVVYTIVASNLGPFGAQDARVQDALPAGITTASWTCAAANGAVCRAAGGTGAIDAPVDLPFNTPGAGATATFTLTMAVPSTFTGPLTNTATIAVAPGNTDSNVTNNSANDTDQPVPRLTISKVSLGGTGAFAFTGNNGIAAQTLTTTIAGTPVSGAIQALTTVGAVTTITESAPPTGYVLTDITCTNVPAGGAATPNLATRTVSLDAAATAAGANITCTFTNTLTQPALSITKTSNGPWTVGQTGATYTLNVSNTGNLATSGTITVRDQLPTGIGIRPGSGFTPATGWTCTYSDELAQSNSIITPNTGMAITCTSTNAIAAGGTVALTLPVLVTSTSPASVINRASVGGGGDPFNGGVAPIPGPMCANAHCSTTSTAITASPPAPASCPSGAAVNLLSPAPFQATLNADNTTQTLTATLLPTAGTYTVGTGTAGRFVVDMNWRWSPGFGLPSNASTLTLRVNGTDYATLTTQAGFPGFGTLVASNGASLFGGTTTMDTNRVSVENIWLTLPASVTTISSLQMLYVSGSVADDFIFSGSALYGCMSTADLSITKTDGVTQYAPGDTLTYTIVASNAGPGSADNAVFTDPAVSGLTAGSVTCGSAAGGAACPVVANTTVALMQGTGIVIPTLPSGGSVTFTVTATVNAAATGALVNTVTITPPSNISDPNAANNTAADTDQPASRLTIRKISLGGVDSFGFSGSNGVATQTLTTTTDGAPVAGVTQALTTASTATTITEGTSPVTYQVSDITCTGLGAGGTATPDLAARTVALDAAATAPGSDIVCTFTNTLQQTDIQVVKTASPDPVVTGNVVSYQIVVSNNGPQAVTDVLLTDVAGAGQDCTTPSTTATCLAAGGASCPLPTVPVSNLLGAGVTIPTLPVGGTVTFGLQCRVTASGL